MRNLPKLFENNRRWASAISGADPGFFRKLARQQSPKYLWIGCSDSRVPANEIVGLLPGELFVHRNVANLAVHTDMNCLSVIQYAVEVLGVEHVIVCGHYGCGGINAAVERRSHGLIDNWLRHIRDVMRERHRELSRIQDPSRRIDRICELNVVAQVMNVGNTTSVQRAWRQGRPLSVHGWIYGLKDGLLKDLGICIASGRQLQAIEKG